MNCSIILFDGFETLDAFGPVEGIGTLAKALEGYAIEYYSENGGMVVSAQNVRVETLPMSGIGEPGIVLIPGGMGTRREVNNEGLMRSLWDLCERAQFVLTVCTGSGLLAKTGLLDGVRATSNKMAFDWAVEQGPQVQWVRRARWVHDGKYYTSSGVSAGIDMSLGFVSDRMGEPVARRIAHGIEYLWNSDAGDDPFYRESQ